MRDLTKDYKNRSFDEQKLLVYGFKKVGKNFVFERLICHEQFNMIVTITKNKATSKLIDLISGEEYSMVDVIDSSGVFVGKVKEEYENCLNDIINNCTYQDIFKESQTKKVIKYVKEKYGADVEYLWEDNDAGIWRNKDNQKWYGVLMKVKESSFQKSTINVIKKNSINSKSAQKYLKDNSAKSSEDKFLEVLDLRYDKEKTFEVSDFKSVYPAFHMNKKSWISIVLDNSLEDEKVFKYIEHSYNLIATKNTGCYMIPANENLFDIFGYFETFDTITWHKTSKMKEGDFVYIYMSAPYSAIMFKLYVSEVHTSRSGKKTVMLKLLEKYDKNTYPLSLLREHGINSVHFPRSLPRDLFE